jgi:hypothetical protein
VLPSLSYPCIMMRVRSCHTPTVIMHCDHTLVARGGDSAALQCWPRWCCSEPCTTTQYHIAGHDIESAYFEDP